MNTMNDTVLDAFCESVNAARSGDADRIAAAESNWREVRPTVTWTKDDEYDDYEGLWEARYGRKPWWH